MRDVSQYFDLLEKTIEYSAATAAELEIMRFDTRAGLIEGAVYFSDGARLEFSELVVLEKRRVRKQEYRYQFVQDGAPVFRYDNAAHHEHIATHPHHKHAGDEILPAIEPNFGQVLDEATALLREPAQQPAKKRRPRKPRKSKR